MPEPEPDPNAEIRRLERELGELRDRRVAIQRRVAERGVLSLGVGRVSRDRSALTAPSIEAAEAQVQVLYDRLATSWDEVDSTRVVMDQLRVKARDIADFSPVEAAFAAEASLRQRVAADAAKAGLLIDVPEPFVEAARKSGQS